MTMAQTAREDISAICIRFCIGHFRETVKTAKKMS